MSKFKVITLCGSTRFKKEFMEQQKRLTLEGNVVISVGLFGHSGDNEVWDGMDEGTLGKTKEMLDKMHKQKIDMCDEIFVINVGGYIGESTKSEISYAINNEKIIKFLEKPADYEFYEDINNFNKKSRSQWQYICNDMRWATKEEKNSIDNHIEKISESTGYNFF